MRRDVVRVGIGRLCFELALGIVVVSAYEHALAHVAAAIAGALVGHFAMGRGARRAFVAAHVALGAAAIPSHVAPAIATMVLATALGFAIEIAHLDLLQRRRQREDLRTLRVPSSLVVRRLGTFVVAAAAGRAALPVLAVAARPLGIAPIFVVLGAIVLLTAGFAAGPGRPVARPIDAAVFVLLSLALAIPA